MSDLSAIARRLRNLEQSVDKLNAREYAGRDALLETITLPSGALYVSATGAGVATSVEVGKAATGNRHAFIDLVGDDNYLDFGLRILRGNTGPNANSILSHRGTGLFIIDMVDAATGFEVKRAGDTMARFDSSSVVFFKDTGIGAAPLVGHRTYIVGETAVATRYALVVKNSALTNLMYLENNGTAFVNSAWSVSDERAKNVEKTMTKGKDVLRKLKGKSIEYELKATPGKTHGYRAQDLQLADPVLVRELSHCVHCQAMAGEHEGADHLFDATLGTQETLLLPYLINAVNELLDTVEGLQTQVADLESKVK